MQRHKSGCLTDFVTPAMLETDVADIYKQFTRQTSSIGLLQTEQWRGIQHLYDEEIFIKVLT